jgi:hypothetical protein
MHISLITYPFVLFCFCGEMFLILIFPQQTLYNRKKNLTL